MPGEIEHVIVHERVPEEARIAHLHRGVPRHGQCQQQQHAPPRRPGRQRALAREHQEDRNDRERPERAEDVLRHRGHAEAGVEDGEPPTAGALVSDGEARVGEHDAEHEHHVGLYESPVQVHSEIRDHHQAGEQRDARAAEDEAEPRGDDGDADGGERRPHARGRFADAGDGKRAGHEPVEDRRLVEVAHTVGVGRDPVAHPRHLARDLGVETLGRIDERRPAQAQKIECGGDEGHAEGDPAHRAAFPSADLHDRVVRQPPEEIRKRLLEVAAVARLERDLDLVFGI